MESIVENSWLAVGDLTKLFGLIRLLRITTDSAALDRISSTFRFAISFLNKHSLRYREGICES